MFTKSIWNSFADVHEFPTLKQDISADVAIIGGGITGITTAHLLARKGLKVVVLENRKVGGGTTSHSTGNLYFTIDQILSSLLSKWDMETVRKVMASRSQAVDQIERLVQEFNLDCDFKRVNWLLYAAEEGQNEKIIKELEVLKETGAPVSDVTGPEFPYSATKAISVPNQAQINPMRYVQELARAVASENCQIYECTHVKEINDEDDHFELETPGGDVKAKYVVHATHTPKGIFMVHTLLGPYREYGVACKVRGQQLPEGIFWGYHEGGSKVSSRTYERDGHQFVMVVGEPHKVGQEEDNQQRIKNLEAFAKKHFDVEEVVYRWGGQHYRPADLLPYIGRKQNNSNEFIATGYSTDGLTYGTLAGMMIADELTGVESPYTELYRANRKTPLKSAQKFLKENINVAGQYFKAIPKGTEGFNDIKNDDGRIVNTKEGKVAAFRDEMGKLTVVSAICPHMGCVVNWNNAERTWDCPCHGSRFHPDGSLLEGPAINGLSNVELED